jgi:hypothetical protein
MYHQKNVDQLEGLTAFTQKICIEQPAEDEQADEENSYNANQSYVAYRQNREGAREKSNRSIVAQ